MRVARGVGGSRSRSRQIRQAGALLHRIYDSRDLIRKQALRLYPCYIDFSMTTNPAPVTPGTSTKSKQLRASCSVVRPYVLYSLLLKSTRSRRCTSWIRDCEWVSCQRNSFRHLSPHIRTENVLLTFFLMMACHPEIITRAHEEIDSVLHQERLPTIEGRKSLPIVDCIVKECLRYVCLS